MTSCFKLPYSLPPPCPHPGPSGGGVGDRGEGLGRGAPHLSCARFGGRDTPIAPHWGGGEAWFNFSWSKNYSLSCGPFMRQMPRTRLEVVCLPRPPWGPIPSDRERSLETLGSRAAPPGGSAFAGPGGRPALAPLAPPRFEPLARLSARALPPTRSCSRFGCSGFPRRGGGGDSARSDAGLGFPHQCRAAPGGPRRPSLLPGTTFHSHGARGGASARCRGTRAPSPPLSAPAPLLGNLPPRPAAPRRWRPLPRELRFQRRLQHPLPAPIGAEGWSRALREPPAPSREPQPLSQSRRALAQWG